MKYWLTEEYRQKRRKYYAANYKSQTNPQRHQPTTCMDCGASFENGKSYHHSGRCRSCKNKIDLAYYYRNRDRINAARREKYQLKKGLKK